MTIGAHSVWVINDAGDGIADLSCLTTEVTVTHGRGDSTSAPEASAASFDLVLTDNVLPPTVEIGSLIRIRTTLPTSATYTRFIGRVTDIALDWVEAGEQTPNNGAAQIVCTSKMADLGRRVVGDAPFPQELDGARVARVMNLAGYPVDPGTSDPGIVQIVPRDIDATDALSVIQETAQSAGGMLWETRDGDIRYADSEHRRNLPSALTLDVCDILVTPIWQRNTQGLINYVSLGYGVVPDEGEQPQYTASAADSITKYGRYGYSASTELAALADAQALAGLLLARNSTPVWVMESLPVDMTRLTNGETAALLGLDMHSLVTLTGLPLIAATAPTNAHFWVEGVNERLTYGGHEIELVVSGYCRTAPAPRWIDISTDYAWNEMGALTWRDATCLGPPLTTGRWADVPASERWQDVPASTTWANYEG